MKNASKYIRFMKWKKLKLHDYYDVCAYFSQIERYDQVVKNKWIKYKAYISGVVKWST